jgi:predicted porin
MRKQAFALAALAAASVTAHAQSSVTLYGVIDGSIEYVNRVASSAATPNQGGSRFGMPSVGGLSASRWGLRGVEDLGGGNQALFVLESGFQWDTGALQSALCSTASRTSASRTPPSASSRSAVSTRRSSTAWPTSPASLCGHL